VKELKRENESKKLKPSGSDREEERTRAGIGKVGECRRGAGGGGGIYVGTEVAGGNNAGKKKWPDRRWGKSREIRARQRKGNREGEIPTVLKNTKNQPNMLPSCLGGIEAIQRSE